MNGQNQGLVSSKSRNNLRSPASHIPNSNEDPKLYKKKYE